MMTPMDDYELIDVGGAGRLERFGERTVDRPAPAALGSRTDLAAWRNADLRFDRDGGWSGPSADRGMWPARFGAVTLELQPTEAGQVGVFPEHAALLPWLLATSGDRVLHLFAYTGLVTLALAAAGRTVTHVDAARPAVAWARRNAVRSDLADRPVRWIVDDARDFVAREARRGRRYDTVILDPPTYGHGTAGRTWRLEADLPALLGSIRTVLEPDGSALLTAHTPGVGERQLQAELRAGLRRPAGDIETGELSIAARDGQRLDLGAFARVSGQR
jgi:23S rRNA (cytosine1962-C5)-methyltransferase